MASENDFAFAKYMEVHHDCTGVCQTGLFRVGTSPGLGIPTQDCRNQV